jgi:hypothetical protein
VGADSPTSVLGDRLRQVGVLWRTYPHVEDPVYWGQEAEFLPIRAKLRRDPVRIPEEYLSWD